MHNCAAPTYWCHICYERVEHEDEPHHVQDLDSASDESDQDDDDAKSNESDQRDEGHHEELDYEHDDSASLRSDSLKSWNKLMQPQDDACSWSDIGDDCSSNSSFMLPYVVL